MGGKRMVTEGGSLDIFMFKVFVMIKTVVLISMSPNLHNRQKYDVKTEVKGNNFPNHSAQKMWPDLYRSKLFIASVMLGMMLYIA